MTDGRIFHGLSAFPITPASPDGVVDTRALSRLLEPLLSSKAQSIGLLGSTGTYAYLGRAERRRASEAALQVAAGRKPVVVGVGALRTDEAVALARDAEDAGADGLLLAPVSYTPLTQDEAFEHFRAVAGASGLPLCIYNNPGTTHFTFGESLLARLAELPTVAGVKMPLPADGNFAGELKRLRARLPEGFVVGYSGDWGCAGALLAGADAWFSVVAGLFPDEAAALTRAAMAGDAERARRIERRFLPLWSLFQAFGSLRVVYVLAALKGLTDAAPPRPLLPLAEPDRARVAEALAALEADEDI